MRKVGRHLAVWQAAVVESGLVESSRLTVTMDYGQFYLVGSPAPCDGDVDLVDLIAQASDGDQIAQSGNLLVVLSPHQNNFEMALLVQRWDAEPPVDLPVWEEVFEASIEVGESGLGYQSPTLADHDLGVPPGCYGIRIAGRGFVNRGWPGSTTPGDEWRIQLWPSTAKRTPQRIVRWAGPATS
jgi:hypothetical protein